MKTPTIEKDGSVGEVSDYSGRMGDYYERVKVVLPEIPLYLSKEGSETRLEKEIFRPYPIAFRVDKTRTAMATVLVHCDFLDEIKDMRARKLETIKHLNKLTPWLFTYGKRIEKNENRETSSRKT